MNLLFNLSVIMENTLENNSGILKKKTKFFLNRVVGYFSFLLLPILIPKSIHLHLGIQALLISFYVIFIVGQWFLLGKEIDHRLKIYFRVNSSIDRVIYRLFLGMFFFVLLFNLINLLGPKWINNSFWIIWSIQGLFYSWPTRGKIIQESVSSNFGEFRFLDRFEKTLLFIIFLMFFFSFPELPPLMNVETLKLYFDPMEKMSGPFWNFMTINFFPFKDYPTLFRLGWSLHFYLVNVGFFLLIFYAFMRFFVSRRLSLLGVFALISSWSFNKMLAQNTDFAILSTYSLLWVWTLLWATKSSTYRAGLFLGLVSYWGTLLNLNFSYLAIFQMGILYALFLKNRNFWFQRQFIKYASFGWGLGLFYFCYKFENLTLLHFPSGHIGGDLRQEISRKSFYILSYLGPFIIVLARYFKEFQIEKENLKLFLSSLAAFLICAYIADESLMSGFSLLWPLAFLSIIPIEFIFQSLSRLRYRRNMIYLIYILICLLDSHFEGRVKIFLKIFNR